ncbi:squalene/phytoene synthase family protein [Luteipulveratus sp. YIM 133132]|uniref:phytoene/squalene synthase family protein n=1 Tax=Luteipulveratus flavus TaxID=3031728 RepID=UPI0023AE8AEF|nr:squalene/phytoene synthase family protein [Luteipulveratus sp. YIM 133132]MDE9365717.1 squalene/phytoene synthase family protein [Luteipulveratus sp. YIM 133132]
MSLRVSMPLRRTRRLSWPGRSGQPPVDGQDLYDERLYDDVARDAAASVIRAYSSSFGLASRLLQQPVRDRIAAVYALVRLADEVVDGRMGVSHPDRAAEVLDRLELETTDALAQGYSSNLVVHAFAATARECGIGADLVTPFFASMRTDLTVREHDAESFARYVYGSAEVVGLMCLKAFLATPGHDEGYDRDAYDRLAPGAQALGAAFQKVNFLRDLAEDYRLRGRRYFPDVRPEQLTEAQKNLLLDDIDADLATAMTAVTLLPDSSRSAVAVAHAVFTDLAERLRATPATEILRQRVRVPGPVKARIAVATYLRDRS